MGSLEPHMVGSSLSHEITSYKSDKLFSKKISTFRQKYDESNKEFVICVTLEKTQKKNLGVL